MVQSVHESLETSWIPLDTTSLFLWPRSLYCYSLYYCWISTHTHTHTAAKIGIFALASGGKMASLDKSLDDIINEQRNNNKKQGNNNMTGKNRKGKFATSKKLFVKKGKIGKKRMVRSCYPVLQTRVGAKNKPKQLLFPCGTAVLGPRRVVGNWFFVT